MLFLATSLLALAGLVSAADHYVEVGRNGLTFEPYAMVAAPGDRVIFRFHAKNHTVTETSFGNVCQPLDGGFDTGFQPVAPGTAEESLPTRVYEVTTGAEKPLWFYCHQKGHCGQGMVFSINCPLDSSAPNSFDKFQQSALEFGAWESASSSWAATAPPDVYGSQTYSPVYHPTVTQTITLGDQVWTTEYESYPNSPDPTPDAAEGNTHKILVGLKDDGSSALVYSPPSIAAAPRDKVVFEFHAKNHTITQSSFGNPCRKLEFTSTTGQIGFDSGFIPVDAAATEFPTYTIIVNDTAPIWAYCRQGNHCGSGMVFSINPDEASDRNHAAFVALAQTINGTSAAPSPSATGQVSNSGAFTGATINTIAAAMVGLGSFFALVL